MALHPVYKRPRALPANHDDPPPTLFAAFHDTRENSSDFILRLRTYLEQKNVPAGTILWRQGDASTDGIYLVEEGTLRSTQEFNDTDAADGTGVVRYSMEVILPGTISGEIGLFTGTARTSTVVAETHSILWVLNEGRFQQMIKQDPALAIEFMRISMTFSAGEYWCKSGSPSLAPIRASFAHMTRSLTYLLIFHHLERLNTMTAYAFNLS